MLRLLIGLTIAICIKGSIADCQDFYINYDHEYADYEGSGWGPGDAYACNNTFYYYNSARYCAQIFLPTLTQYLRGEANSSAFQPLCSEGADCFKQCMMEKFSGCSSEFQQEIEDIYVPAYVSNYCNGTDIATHLVPYEGTYNPEAWINSYAGLGCDISGLVNQFGRGQCFDQLTGLWYAAGFDSNNNGVNSATESPQYSIPYRPFADDRERLSRIIRSLLACIANNATIVLRNASCDVEESNMFGASAIYLYIYYVIPGIDYQLSDLLQLYIVKETPGEAVRQTCVVFGDPHMFIVKADGSTDDRYITCAAPGRQDVLSNTYVDISGFNTAPNPAWKATYMTQVTITFFDKDTGSRLGQYIAEDTKDYSYQLPTTFVNGNANLYYALNSSTIAVTLTQRDRFMVMEYKDTGVVLSLARFSYTYMLAVRQSRSVFLKSSGLCIEGCVPIDRNTVIIQSRRKRATTEACADVPEEYYESCQFDFTVTGNATMAAGPSQEIGAVITETESRDVNVITEEGFTTNQPDDTTTMSSAIPLKLAIPNFLLLVVVVVISQ